MTPPIDLPRTATLTGFRADLYRCSGGWADALFELCDALLSSPGPVSSVPHLSLEPVFRRSHSQPVQGFGARRDRRRGAAPGAGRPSAEGVGGGVRSGHKHVGAL
ncbi:MAG: hypothetical protein ACRDYA_17035 [Egibacteraceae bacterium]